MATTTTRSPVGTLVWLLVCTVLLRPSTYAWHYGNEDKWDEQCLNGRRQSPINLQKYNAEVKTFTPLQFEHYDDKFTGEVVNNGHTVRMGLKGDHRPEVRGGGLPSVYVLDHLHFHWESEHTLHSNRYPLELHLVHYDKKYNSTNHALNSEQGLAVLGVLFDISEDDNEALEPLIKEITDDDNELEQAEKLDDDVKVKDFLPEDIEGFYRYEGSLTTPNCNEAVIWTVFTDMQKISLKQLEAFQSLKTGVSTLTENFRTLQQLNGRVVTLKLSSRQNAASTTYLTSVWPIVLSGIIAKYIF